MRKLSAVLIAFLLAAPAAYAQQASVIGVVADQSKAVLPGVTVTLTDIASGVSFSAVSDDKGEYRLLNVPPGTYKVQAELAGFATVVLDKVEFLVGQHATIPFTLRLAGVAETLTVTGESPLVDTTSSQVAGNVDRRQMEELPLQGRNWMELSKLVKGVTANDVGNSIGTGNMDDMWQLNLDGQQITQKVAGSGFGQPRFSREAIAEFQIVTNMFDITQGRSAGMEIQAISKSGTNQTSGSGYGFFRSDSFNAADPVANKVLPYSNQQVGGTLGGAIVKDKAHYFVSYEYEREPGTAFQTPSLLPLQSTSVPYQNGQKSFLARVDDQLTTVDRLSVRGSYWTWQNPFVVANGTTPPSESSNQTKNATNILGTWTKVMAGGNRLLEIKGGYNGFHWTNAPQDSMIGTPEYRIPGMTIGAPYNYPQTLKQDNWDGRVDLSWHKTKHDVKIGGEYIHVHDGGPWYIQRVGFFNFSAAPPAAILNAAFPAGSELDPTKWNVALLNPYVTNSNINFTQGDWTIDAPRPTYALWIGDNWRASSNLTVNMGVRWDADPNMASPPGIVQSNILVNNQVPASYGAYATGTNDFGYKSGIRDWKDVAPRAGFTYNVGGNNDLVIRGGTGIYFASPVSNVTFSPQLYSQLVSAQFVFDGRSDFITNPTNGLTTDQIFSGKVKLPAQVVRSIEPGFASPYNWQSSIGFQKQLNAVTGFDVDITHWTEYRDTRTVDGNLIYNPATGYNLNNGANAVRPNPAYGPVFVFTSDGKRDQTQMASSLTRRLKDHFQAGVTWTLMFEMKDNGVVGYGTAPANNPFDYLDGELTTSQDFQRNTIRTWALAQLPLGINASVSYFYGSGNRFNDVIATAPYGKTGNNRLNLAGNGGPEPAITIPAGILDRWDGPATIASGQVIPRNALQGLPLHKVDVHVTKDISLGGHSKAQLIGEVFNLFNHANYGAYNTSLNPANPSTFGLPATAGGTAYVSRQGQLGFRITF
ncbi:MAG: carboxypeptidase-like regulatory domain-containing protein [Acidobacteriia bacterium]|nr:carboxypeptidase-like regulatory domain-containing protein [Terriglobia bacterium]